MGEERNPFASLRDVARERRNMEQDEPTWLSRRAGTLAADEERALSARAESDPYVAHMLAFTEPLDESGQAALDLKVAALIAGAPSSQAQAAKVVALPVGRTRNLRNTGAIAAVLACAAAVLLFVRNPSEPTLLLPPYEGELRGTDQAVRSSGQAETAGRQRISRGAQVTLIMQPLEALPSEHEKLAARLYLQQGAKIEALTLPIELSPQGALRLSTPYYSLFGERKGAWDVLLFVGLAGHLPRDNEQALERAESEGTDLRVQRFRVELAP